MEDEEEATLSVHEEEKDPEAVAEFQSLIASIGSMQLPELPVKVMDAPIADTHDPPRSCYLN